MATHATDDSTPDADVAADTQRRPEPPELLTADEAAGLLRVRRAWVYAHARELGGWRLLDDRGPWRFSRRELLRAASPPASDPKAVSAQRRRPRVPRPNPSIPLLPIRRRLI